jgi:hypothetical protein
VSNVKLRLEAQRSVPPLSLHDLLRESFSFFLIWLFLTSVHPNTAGLFQLVMSLLSLENLFKRRSLSASCVCKHLNVVFYRQFGASSTRDVPQPRVGHPCSITSCPVILCSIFLFLNLIVSSLFTFPSFSSLSYIHFPSRFLNFFSIFDTWVPEMLSKDSCLMLYYAVLCCVG